MLVQEVKIVNLDQASYTSQEFWVECVRVIEHNSDICSTSCMKLELHYGLGLIIEVLELLC